VGVAVGVSVGVGAVLGVEVGVGSLKLLTFVSGSQPPEFAIAMGLLPSG
jgi:hypothetical protein